MQRGLGSTVRRIGVATPLEEVSRGLQPAFDCGNVERRLPVPRFSIHVGTGFEEGIDGRNKALLRGIMQRSPLFFLPKPTAVCTPMNTEVRFSSRGGMV